MFFPAEKHIQQDNQFKNSQEKEACTLVNIAFYGKGGIGKSTIISNVTSALAEKGRKVLQIGCDPKHDSTRLVLGGFMQSTVLEQLNTQDIVSLDEVMLTGYKGIKCIEAGGPEPGVGCAGRGIIQMVNLLKEKGLNTRDFDFVFFDVLGDVVCGGFAVPMREGYADQVYIITSGEFMSLYAANNIAKGLKSHSTIHGKLAGVIGNERGTKRERELITAFAKKIGTEMVGFIPRSELVQAAELESKTVIEYAPSSELADIYRSIASTIENNKTPVVPTPLADEELEEFVSEFCYGKKIARKTISPAPKNLPPTNAGNINQVSIDLTKPFGAKNIPKTRPPTYGCSLAGAYAATSQILDGVSVMDSPVGCAFNSLCTTMSTGSNLKPETSIFPNLLCSDMRERDVVFGAESNLEKMILDTNRRLKPTAFFVITSCPSGIIGEDFDRVITQLQKNGLEVVRVNSDGVMGGDFNNGLLTAYKNIAEHFIDANVNPIDDTVNIIGEPPLASATDQNYKELEKILNQLKIKINCRFIKTTNINDIKQFKKAGLNIAASTDPVVQSLAEYFENQFAVPTLKAPMPIGFEQTEAFTRTLAQRFKKEAEAENLIQQARADYMKKLLKLKRYMANKKVMIFSQQSNIDWAISTLLDLNVNLQKVCLSHVFYLREPFTSKYIGKVNIEPDYPIQNYEKDVLANKPDLVLMNFALNKSSNQEAIYDILPYCPTYGFNSGLVYVQKWVSRLRMPHAEDWRLDEKLFYSPS